jgi:putative ABC transport system permease protein
MRPVSDRYVGDRYFEKLDLKLLAGRVFDRNRDTPIARPDPAQEQTVIIDETFARQLGFASPQAAVGQLIYTPNPAGAVAARVIGVTQTELSTLQAIETPFGKVEGSIYRFSYYPGFGWYLPLVRIARADVAQAIPEIEAMLGELGPSGLVGVQRYEDRFREAYRQYGRISELFILLGGVAFFIASVGLLGIAVHVASRRRHEIAVRKTLGSSVARVIRLLLTDFSIPVLIGNLLAWPLGYLATQVYLSAFAERIELNAAPFLASMVITLLIAWAAVIGVVLKTATLRPAEVLRRA